MLEIEFLEKLLGLSRRCIAAKKRIVSIGLKQVDAIKSAGADLGVCPTRASAIIAEFIGHENFSLAKAQRRKG